MGPTCASKGALEVYLEPHLPKPLVIAVGRSPAVDALATMAQAVGWEARVVDDGGDPASHSAPELVSTDIAAVLNPSAAGSAAPDSAAPHYVAPDGATAVVVATQGHYDEEALRAALASDAGYVGLVASRERAASVLKWLAEAGVSDLDLARVHAPAGADLGQVSHAEIAVCVLADLVERRARGELMVRVAPDAAASGDAVSRVTAPPAATPDAAGFRQTASAAPAAGFATDPVCGMTVTVATARYRFVHDGIDYFFCCVACHDTFSADASDYVGAS